MADEPSDDVKSHERASKGVETTSKTVEAISPLVDGDHIEEIMRMQKSV